MNISLAEQVAREKEEYFFSFEMAFEKACKLVDFSITAGRNADFLNAAKETIVEWWVHHSLVSLCYPYMCTDEWSDFPASYEAAIFKLHCYHQEKRCDDPIIKEVNRETYKHLFAMINRTGVPVDVPAIIALTPDWEGDFFYSHKKD